MSTRPSTAVTMTDATALKDKEATVEPTADEERLSTRGKPTPFTHSWRDPEIAGQRSAFIKAMVGSLVITMVAVFSICCIYWGAFWKAPDHAHNLNIHVVDLDGAGIGQAVHALFTSPQVTGARQQLTYTFANPGDFSSADQVSQYIHDEKAWAGIVIGSGATQSLINAVTTRDATYNASNAITVYVATARQENAIPRIITPQLTGILERFTATFAEMNARNLSNIPGLDIATLLRTAPALVTKPVNYHYVELAAFDVPVAAAVDFVGLIYLLIIAFLVAMMNYNIRLATGLNTLLTLRSLLILRFIVPFVMYFFMSWVYSFISLAFQVPFSRHYGHGGFVLYWILSFLGMTALGLAVETLITVLGPRFIPYFLLLWIIANVSVAFFPIPLLPGIFRYGYAMPFYNVGQAVRTIVFGTKNHLGTNYGILLGWIGLSCVTMTLLTVIMRRREVAAVKAGRTL